MALNPGSDLSAKRLEITALLNKLSLRQRNIDSTMPLTSHPPCKPLPGNLAKSHDHFPQLDGPIELEGRRKRLGGDVCLVFVHAGAGYHSVQNERTHLAACEDASRSAMTFLNNGSTAVEAVEIAIKVLEDKEITNAGFGSNLTMDGTVECDATIVDHYGRSGAVGAIGCIRNPVHVARLVLEQSNRPLSLRRVPPNLLVGQGATDFAAESGVPVLHPGLLISPAADERFRRWTGELHRATPVEKTEENARGLNVDSTTQGDKNVDESLDCPKSELDHCWNESQPYSPTLHAVDRVPLAGNGNASDSSHQSKKRRLYSSNDAGTDGQESVRSVEEDDDEDSETDDEAPWDPLPETYQRQSVRRHIYFPTDSSSDTPGCEYDSFPSVPPPTRAESPSLQGNPLDGHGSLAQDTLSSVLRDDDITDTVGAIAIDCFGNIAAGSSSGGIGMKHGGRVGPAALVGIGSAVVPIDPSDREKACVATVTSGTGEHMATTLAAGSCANRLYTSTYRGRAGGSESTDEDNAIRSFVERDFMGHPSVKNSHSTGAIGVLGVKKTVDGVTLYFAHNTDSFAVASMANEDKEPRSVMSRSKGNGKVVTGARRVRHRGYTSIRNHTWPSNPDKTLGPFYETPTPPKSTTKKRPSKNKSSKAKANAEQPSDTSAGSTAIPTPSMTPNGS